MNSKVGLVLAALLLGALGYLYYGERQRARILDEENLGLRGANERMYRELEDVRKGLVDATELERLKAEQREAIRLRGELTNLKQQVSSANDNAARARAEAEKARAKAGEAGSKKLVVPKVFSRQTAASLPPGESLMIGGWETKPGRRTYAFVSPTMVANSPNTVLVTARLVEMDLAVANQFASMAVDSNGNVMFNAEDSEALFNGFNETAGVDVLATPRIQTTSGVQGSVSMTEQKDTANGPMNFGPEISINPTIGLDGKIHLAVDAKITVEEKSN